MAAEQNDGDTSKAPTRSKVTRRRWLGGAGAAGLALLLGERYTYAPRVTRRTLWLPRLPKGWDGVQVVHVTDLHRGPLVSGGYLDGALRTARALPHEALFLTGDFVSVRAGYVEDVARMLRGWRPPMGAWAVLGNHDYHTGADHVTRALEAIGIPVMKNTATRLRRGGDDLWLVGTDDPSTSHADLKKALRGVPAASFRLLLAHSPDIAWQFQEDCVDLALTGHTHGGQVCLPGGQAIIAATSLGVDYARGLFMWRGATLLVNRGLGVVALPLRAFCPPEIAHLTLRRGTGV